jgi:hypothetical protein
MKIAKPVNIKIHFILGATRSGTTLLYHLLNNHKNCVSSPEIKHLLFFYKKYRNIREVSKELMDDIGYYGTIMEQASDHTNTGSELDIALGEKINYFELCKRIYFTAANPKKDRAQITTIVDKNPFYTLKADSLACMLPDAKFLCAVRDYRGFVLSNIQSAEPFAKNASVRSNSIVWMFYNKLVWKIQEKYRDKTRIVLYENLVSDKEKVFREICQFFDIEYDPDSFNYLENINNNDQEERFADKRTAYKRSALLKPVNAERVDAWKGYFSDFQLKIMDFWCSNTGEKFGYKRTTEINPVESILILMTSLPYYLRALIYFKLRSVKLNFYLNEGRKAKYFNAMTKGK